MFWSLTVYILDLPQQLQRCKHSALKIQSFTFSSCYLVDLRRVELLTSSLQMKRSNQLNYRPKTNGGRTKVRTWDLSLIRTAL